MEQFIFEDENKMYQFDFSKATYATDQLNQIYHQSGINTLNDVDFIIETEHEIILMEYKNSKIRGAAKPEGFDAQIMSDKHYNKIINKFYGSLIYTMAANPKKTCKYIYILESQKAGSSERKRLRNKIATKLPFTLQQRTEIKKPLITDFQIYSIEEWNTHPTYNIYPITEKEA